MTESDERPDAAKLAGRALRALRTQQPEQTQAPEVTEPAEPEVAESAELEVTEPEAPEPEPAELEVTEPETTEPTEPVSLAKPDAATPEESADVDAKAPRATNYLLVVSAVLAVLALAFAVIGLVVHLHGTDSPEAARASARDDVVTAARIDIATLQTLDYKDVKAGLDKWLAVTTGSFHDDIAKAAKSDTSAIASAKRVTVGKVLASAVTDLDTDKGTATVIASVEVTRTPEGGTSTVDRNRYRANLTRVDGVWKISNLGQVPVALS